MIDKITNTVIKDIKILTRDKTFILILSIFFLISIVSVYIGELSQYTINQVYDEAAKDLIRLNKPVPPSPFSSIPPLDIMKNMIIYIVLLGSLLAIILGHIVIINDRKSGVLRILFSRPFSKKEYLIGKIISISVILVLAVFTSMIISIGAISISSTISFSSIFDVLIFYAFSFLYLIGFVYLGIYFGIREKSSTKAVLFPLLLWVLITFVIPELGSALYPTISLNPILPDTKILDSSVLTTIHNLIFPFSISEQYKDLAANSLKLIHTDTASNTIRYSVFDSTSVLVFWIVLSLGLSSYAIMKFDASAGDNYE